MNRYDRIKSLLEGEKITITDLEKYQELIDGATEEKFELHVEALKEMSSDGNTYEFTPVEKDGGITLQIIENPEVTEEKSEEVSDEDTTEEKSEEVSDEDTTEEKSEEVVEDKIEEEIEEKQEDMKKENVLESIGLEDINTKLSKLLDLVLSGQSKYESFQADYKEFKEDMSKSYKLLKKKQKDLEDKEYNISKSLSLDGGNMSEEITEKKSLRENIGNILFDKCGNLLEGRAIATKGENE